MCIRDSYKYDAMGRLTETVFPDKTTQKTAYTRNGQVSRTTVSYTHLDVYKRQQGNMLAKLEAPNMTDASGRYSTNIAVSIDVYKRQNLQLCLMEGGFLTDEKGADGYFGKNT